MDLQAVASATALIESKLNKDLRLFLKKSIKGKMANETLAVCDTKIGALIKEKLGIKVSCYTDTQIYITIIPILLFYAVHSR